MPVNIQLFLRALKWFYFFAWEHHILFSVTMEVTKHNPIYKFQKTWFPVATVSGLF